MIPLILAGVGAYLVGSGLTKKKTNSYKGGGEMAKDGYMAKGDMIEVNGFPFELPKFIKENKNKSEEVRLSEEDILRIKKLKKGESENFFVQQRMMKVTKMASGGKMAKGGETTPYIVWVSKDGEKREFFGEYKSQRAAKMAMDKLWEKGEYNSMGNKPKSSYEKNGLYAEGGMMAKGGKLVGNQKKLDLNKNGKLDADDFKMLRENKK